MSQGHLGRSVATQAADSHSVMHFYQRFLAWRKELEPLCRGTIHFYKTSEPILALRRDLGPDRILAAFNLSSEPVHYTLPAPVLCLDGHGLEACPWEGRDIQLPPWGGFFGRLV
jgi:alpha-glucosidase